MPSQRAIRAADDRDIPAMRAILASNSEDDPPLAGHLDDVGPYLRHLVGNHRVLVTEEDGGTVAFGAVVDTGRCLMLSDLFVRRDRIGTGLGRGLLADLFGNAARRATFASADPRALPVYVRAGMTPLWIDLYVEGLGSRLPAVSPAIAAREAAPAECADLEVAWSGADRRVDHASLGSQGAADVFVIEDAGEPVAFAYARAKQVSPARELDRLVVRPDANPVPATLAGLARAARGGLVEACVLGPNPVLPLLLDGGFRVVDRDVYLASDPEIVDPARLLPNAGLL